MFLSDAANALQCHGGRLSRKDIDIFLSYKCINIFIGFIYIQKAHVDLISAYLY